MQIVNRIDNLQRILYYYHMIKRKMAEKLKVMAKKFPVVSVMGPRQSGKTTLVKAVFPEKDYVSLEDPDNREFALSDPRGFLASYPAGAIFDEIQRAPDLFSYIQTLVDAKELPGFFILTGSNNYLLQERITQTLAGRVAILKLLPLSMEELFDTGYEINNYEEVLYRGLYPRIYDKDIEPELWYPGYIQTYVERDVRLIKNITDLGAFQKFIKLCAGRTGQILNLSSLGNDCGINHNTAKSWISILESSFIIFLLQPYHESFNKRIIKSPKLYFYDTGLLTSLLGIESEMQVSTHYLKGNLFESLIISELLKSRFNSGLQPRIYYWRDSSGNEVDCLLENAGRLTPVEIKSGKTVAADFFKGLNLFGKLAGDKVSRSYLVYGGNDIQDRAVGKVLGWRDVNSIF